MTKLLFTIIAGFFISYPILAQDFDYQVSAPYPVIDGQEKHYFYADDEIMAVKINRGVVFIQKWNSGSLKEIGRTEFKDFEKGFQFESLNEFKGNYYLFYSVWDPKAIVEQLFVREIDFSTGTFKDKGRLIISVNGRLTNAYSRGIGAVSVMGIPVGVLGKFNIQSSFDESSVLIQYRKKPENRKIKENHDIIGLNVYDASMNERYKKEVEMPLVEYKMDNIDYTVDNAGNAYILSIVYDGESRKRFDKEGNISYHLELLKLRPDSEVLEVRPIEVEGISITELLLFNLPNDEVVCAGYYTYGRTESYVAGIIIFKVDDKGELKEYRTYDVPLEVINMYKTDRAQAKNEKKGEKGQLEFNSLTITGLYVSSDGSVLINGEQSYIRVHVTVNSKGQSRTTYTYHYNYIVTAKIGSDGELQWMNKLGKTQTGQRGMGGMSFKHFGTGDAHYYMFLDNIKNSDLALNEVPANHTDGLGGFFTSYKVDDETGEISKQPLFDMRDVHGHSVSQFKINRIIPISPYVFCVEVYKGGKQDILIKVNAKM
jgi:hypothetical protein